MFSFKFLILDIAQKITFGTLEPPTLGEKVLIISFIILFLLGLFMQPKTKKKEKR